MKSFENLKDALREQKGEIIVKIKEKKAKTLEVMGPAPEHAAPLVVKEGKFPALYRETRERLEGELKRQKELCAQRIVTAQKHTKLLEMIAFIEAERYGRVVSDAEELIGELKGGTA